MIRLAVCIAIVATGATLFSLDPPLWARVAAFMLMTTFAISILFARPSIGGGPLTCETCGESMLAIAPGLDCTNALHHRHARKMSDRRRAAAS